jgi:hypothetical protein
MKLKQKNMAFGLVLWLFGCQELVKITVAKTDTDNPVFGIESTSLFGGKGVAIPNFSVVDARASTPEVVWSIKSQNGGRIYVREIVYGVVPEGFTEAVVPKTLEPNNVYEAVTGEPGFVGRSASVFRSNKL